jgi:predicted dehydrogenase
VLTEARMARNSREARGMLEASELAPGLVAQIVPAPMSLDLDAAAIRLVNDGRLGAIREVSIAHTFGAYADENAPHTWRIDSALSGHNTLMVGIYYEMARRWVDADPVKVLAHGAVFTGQRTRADGSLASVEIPESITIVGDYLEGGRFIGHFSGVEAGFGRDEIRINGSRGCIRGDIAANELFFTAAGGAEVRVDIPAAERRGWRVEEDFVNSIRTGEPVRLTNFEDGVRYMRFTDAIYRSQEQGGVWTEV